MGREGGAGYSPAERLELLRPREEGSAPRAARNGQFFFVARRLTALGGHRTSDTLDESIYCCPPVRGVRITALRLPF